MKNPDTKNVEVLNTEGRRRFLKRTATGVALASLPAASAWGTGTACSISGNLSTHGSSTACDNPYVNFAGRSGGFWNELNDGQVRSAFTSITTKRAARKRAIPHIKNVIHQAGLANALSGGGVNRQLATAYLNAFYGFYTLPAGMDAQTYTQNLIEQLHNGTFTAYELEKAIEATHVDGVSGYVFPNIRY